MRVRIFEETFTESMKTTTQKNASLRNEGNFTKPANLPSGTFSRDGQPTVVTEIIATIVAREILKGTDLAKINSLETRALAVDFLDSLSLLPQTPNLSKDEKMTKLGMAISFMVTEQETIQARQINIYTACKTALRKSISQLKIAESASKN